MKTTIKSTDRMSNRQYHQHNKPNWWMRCHGEFVNGFRSRGDDYLNVEVDLPDDATEVQIGCGPRNRYGIRETVVIERNES